MALFTNILVPTFVSKRFLKTFLLIFKKYLLFKRDCLKLVIVFQKRFTKRLPKPRKFISKSTNTVCLANFSLHYEYDFIPKIEKRHCHEN